MHKPAIKYLVGVSFILFGFFLLWMLAAPYVPVLANTWHLLTDRGYEIPAGSSIFSFRPTVMNQGSGEWWLYGEDGQYFYYFDGSTKISKQAAARCPGFKPDDHVTWCRE